MGIGKLRCCRKRYVILLEVLIAFVLVVLCIIPLIYPQVYIFKSEKAFINAVELDHTVNLLFADRLQKLYLNEIAWSDVEGEKPMPISEEMLREVGVKEEFPYKGHYQFSITKRKPPPPEDKLYLVELKFTFSPKNPPQVKIDGQKGHQEELAYSYLVFIERRAKQIKDSDDAGDQGQKDEKSKDNNHGK